MKTIPKFETEDQEREFWATHDSTDHVGWSRAKAVSFSRLKPSTRTISLEVPADSSAKENCAPYQPTKS